MVVWIVIILPLFMLVEKLTTAIYLFRIAVPSDTMASTIKDVCKLLYVEKPQMEPLEFGRNQQ